MVRSDIIMLPSPVHGGGGGGVVFLLIDQVRDQHNLLRCLAGWLARGDADKIRWSTL